MILSLCFWSVLQKGQRRRTAGQAKWKLTTDELTFSSWNVKLGLAFSDICYATEMHLVGQKKKIRRWMTLIVN